MYNFYMASSFLNEYWVLNMGYFSSLSGQINSDVTLLTRKLANLIQPRQNWVQYNMILHATISVKKVNQILNALMTSHISSSQLSYPIIMGSKLR